MIVTTKEFFVPGVPLFNCYDQSSLPDSSQRDIRAMVEVMGFLDDPILLKGFLIMKFC